MLTRMFRSAALIPWVVAALAALGLAAEGRC